MPLWRGGPNTRTLPTVLLTPSASKAADMAHLCVPQNQALGVCRGFAPDIQICGTHGRKNLVNAIIISNAEEEEDVLVTQPYVWHSSNNKFDANASQIWTQSSIWGHECSEVVSLREKKCMIFNNKLDKTKRLSRIPSFIWIDWELCQGTAQKLLDIFCLKMKVKVIRTGIQV